MHGFLQASSPLLFSIFVSVLFLLLYVFVTNKYGTNANTNRKGSNEKKDAYKFWKLLCQPP